MSMRATRRAARSRRRRIGLTGGAVLALVAVGVLVHLVTASPPGPGTDTGRAAATPAADARTAVPAPAPTPPATASVAASARTSPSATAAATTAAAAAARPSATGTGRPVSATAALAGRIRPQTRYRGVATSYDAGDGDGACLYGPADDLMVAAMNTTDYESAQACGAYVLVRTSGGASVTVRIVNECPSPCTPGQLDLSTQAFAKLADLSAGRIPITWELVSPRTVGTLSVRYKTGSSRYWCAIQVIGHRNPVARLETRTAGGWRRLPRADYNYFLAEDGGGCGGAIRITDIYGEQLTVDGIALRPDAVQATRVQFAAH
ncbi:hypothetical protein FNH09_10195 [Streptomyces adustus]|uniref:Expansin-like EG45 domain-containing protein n=1 Tax=Streptomyces adustus TaxID=1609272 RepID=A0A5N8VC65_9ACTN|nr:expansin EXLX1 family cellulose-binding protein [Streptomyces adustus]MPY31638.1 hypothetical protein [Streptomyces adustus]